MDGNYVEITAKIVIIKMYIVWVIINLINSIKTYFFIGEYVGICIKHGFFGTNLSKTRPKWSEPKGSD